MVIDQLIDWWQFRLKHESLPEVDILNILLLHCIVGPFLVIR